MAAERSGAGEGSQAPGAISCPSQPDGHPSPRNLTLPGGGGGTENQSAGVGLAASPTDAGSCGVGQGNVAPDAGFRQSPGDGDPSQGNLRLSGPGGEGNNQPEGADLPCDPADAELVKGRSICHHLMKQNKLVFISLDLETGGDRCGIIQLSAELLRIKLKREENLTSKDSLSSVVRGEGVYHEQDNPGGTLFNEYVNPGEDAEWDSDAVGEQSHKLKATDPRIVGARKIGEVWQSFQAFISSNITHDEVGIIITYNGAGSDMKWLWRLTQAPHAPEELPSQLLYYMDPYRILSKWKTCKMQNSKMTATDRKDRRFPSRIL